ncbi:MAG: HIT family protein [Verrucomicrobia bacterium]|nr:HIT family protein [Verrucomicrobiota bacterium]
MTDCIFCQMAKEKNLLLAEFKHCFVIKDQYPVSPGHLLIIPYQHTENWFTSSSEVKAEINLILEKMKKLLDDGYHPDGYNIGMNCGPAAGQTVMHLHVHLIPRYRGDMSDPRGGIRGVIPTKQKYE